MRGLRPPHLRQLFAWMKTGLDSPARTRLIVPWPAFAAHLNSRRVIASAALCVLMDARLGVCALLPSDIVLTPSPLKRSVQAPRTSSRRERRLLGRPTG